MLNNNDNKAKDSVRVPILPLYLTQSERQRQLSDDGIVAPPNSPANNQSVSERHDEQKFKKS